MTSLARKRTTQAERRARSRTALLEAAARGLSRHGYGNLVLEQVAREAGYTRGALYHQFRDKEALALAVVEWIDETWQREVGAVAAWVEETWWAEMAKVMASTDRAVDALIAVCRAHAVYCRRDIARLMTALRVEFSDHPEHPVGRAVDEAVGRVMEMTTQLLSLAIDEGEIRADTPPRVLALAVTGAIEGLVINLAGQEPFDEELAERAVRGILGLPPAQEKR